MITMRRTVGTLVAGTLIGLALGWAIYAGGCSAWQPATLSERGAGAPEAPIRVYFSPSDGPEQAIRAALQSAQQAVHAALYQLTDPQISQALLEVSQRGLEVLILLDDEPSKGSRGCFLMGRGISVKHYVDSGIMHHKFAVIDGQKLITGSYNWTTSAQTRNEENLLVIESPELSAIFEREFQKLWASGKAQPLTEKACSQQD